MNLRNFDAAMLLRFGGFFATDKKAD